MYRYGRQTVILAGMKRSRRESNRQRGLNTIPGVYHSTTRFRNWVARSGSGSNVSHSVVAWVLGSPNCNVHRPKARAQNRAEPAGLDARIRRYQTTAGSCRRMGPEDLGIPMGCPAILTLARPARLDNTSTVNSKWDGSAIWHDIGDALPPFEKTSGSATKSVTRNGGQGCVELCFSRCSTRRGARPANANTRGDQRGYHEGNPQGPGPIPRSGRLKTKRAVQKHEHALS